MRYRRSDRSKGSVGGFGNEQAAQHSQEELECDLRRGWWAEPTGSRATLAEWVRRWWTTLNLDVRALQNHERTLRLHILPRFGHRPMRAIAASDIAKWKLDAAESGYAHSTISGWVNLLSMILTDAADEGLIDVNPVRKLRRRGKRVWSARPERIWATPWQVRRVADQAGELGGPIARLLIITAAWTGCRWGELAALHRRARTGRVSRRWSHPRSPRGGRWGVEDQPERRSRTRRRLCHMGRERRNSSRLCHLLSALRARLKPIDGLLRNRFIDTKEYD
ncbi:MAG TPA: hypothetical protein VGN81_29740 [Pseudonocardiaceae bacterium]